jgi:hypothetical protein
MCQYEMLDGLTLHGNSSVSIFGVRVICTERKINIIT